MARWRSGDVADCKSVHAGSIPARASINFSFIINAITAPERVRGSARLRGIEGAELRLKRLKIRGFFGLIEHGTARRHQRKWAKAMLTRFHAMKNGVILRELPLFLRCDSRFQCSARQEYTACAASISFANATPDCQAHSTRGPTRQSPQAPRRRLSFHSAG